MLIERARLADMIPHAQAMCLLDGVREADKAHIVCVAATHRAPDNPLRRRGGLPAVCGIEYAAQAMAAHGAWLRGSSDTKARRGMLVSVRTARWSIARLDTVASDLIIKAVREAGDARAASYRYTLRADDRVLLSGSATVVFVAGEA